ncbi:hypothetical protein V1514DRAFT_338472 [Lipomyces japonicus]|uniref:uncharacterized protein n=1 Tax=Lipomyces japonicus TaxID=56871 RepID=UPI0034CD26C2
MQAAEAEAHKAAGNKLFGQEDYDGAVQEYTKAILKDATKPTYFTNRAICLLRLEKYERALEDCQKAIELSPILLKAYVHKATSLLALDRPNEALRTAQRGYDLAIEQDSFLTTNFCQTALEAKKRRWQINESRRIEKEGQLLAEMKDILEQSYQQKINYANATITLDIELQDQKETLEYEFKEKLALLEQTFERSDEKYQSREVPDYMIDPISFNIFFDPVISKSGQSFERSVIYAHLKNHKFDPFTREYLTEKDLRPNLALKSACEQFLERNGWAVDY